MADGKGFATRRTHCPTGTAIVVPPNTGRDSAFARIEAYFRARHHELEQAGPGCYRQTPLGAWAASIAANVYQFFRQLGLERQRLFIDLGSGDGLVVCIASLFTRAVGIEIDGQLCATAARAIRDLGLSRRAAVIRGDYRQQLIHHADCLYLYPDKPVADLEKTLAGWQGLLFVAGPHFPLRSLTLLERLTLGRDQLWVYRS